jgi:hypothetical protein
MNTTIRPIVRAIYDLQKVRIAIGNRVGASFRAKLDIAPGEKKEEAEEEVKKILDQIAHDYKLLTDGYAEKGKNITSRNFERCGIFESYAEYELVKSYYQLQKDEDTFFSTLARFVEPTPLWQNFLSGVRGCGPAMAGVILSEIDIHKCRYASSLWKYAGLGVEADGRGTGRYKEHLVDREYIDADGNDATRKSITFNPFLKTKMVGVLGSSFIKQPVDKCQYRRIYDNYKHRLENHPDWQDKTKAHRHNAAVRYMVKMFLLDLWREWRTMEGLDTPDPYHVAKLGLRDHRLAA